MRLVCFIFESLGYASFEALGGRAPVFGMKFCRNQKSELAISLSG